MSKNFASNHVTLFTENDKSNALLLSSKLMFISLLPLAQSDEVLAVGALVRLGFDALAFIIHSMLPVAKLAVMLVMLSMTKNISELRIFF